MHGFDRGPEKWATPAAGTPRRFGPLSSYPFAVKVLSDIPFEHSLSMYPSEKGPYRCTLPPKKMTILILNGFCSSANGRRQTTRNYKLETANAWFCCTMVAYLPINLFTLSARLLINTVSSHVRRSISHKEIPQDKSQRQTNTRTNEQTNARAKKQTSTQTTTNEWTNERADEQTN